MLCHHLVSYDLLLSVARLALYLLALLHERVLLLADIDAVLVRLQRKQLADLVVIYAATGDVSDDVSDVAREREVSITAADGDRLYVAQQRDTRVQRAHRGDRHDVRHRQLRHRPHLINIRDGGNVGQLVILTTRRVVTPVQSRRISTAICWHLRY